MVTRAFRAMGWAAIGYELKKDNDLMDIMSARGYLAALSYALKLKPGHGVMLAPVCSSYVACK